MREANRNKALLRAQRALALAALTLGVEPPPVVPVASFGNAASDGHRILVDVDWLGLQAIDCTSVVCEDSWLVGLMAHELGHHVRQDAAIYRYLSSDQQKLAELRADAIAGHVLGTLGVEPLHFARILARLSPDFSCTHPAGRERAEVIVAYYKRAKWLR